MLREVLSFIGRSEYVSTRLVSRQFNDVILALCTNGYTHRLHMANKRLSIFAIFMSLFEEFDPEKMLVDDGEPDTCAIFSFSIGDKGRRVLVSGPNDAMKITYSNHPFEPFKEHYSYVFIDHRKNTLYCFHHIKSSYTIIKCRYTYVVDKLYVVLDGDEYYPYDIAHDIEHVQMSELHRIHDIRILGTTKKAIVSFWRKGEETETVGRHYTLVDNIHLKMLRAHVSDSQN